LGLEDLLRVIHLLSRAPLSSNQRQQQGQAQLPGGYPTGTGAGAHTSPFSLFNAQAARSTSGNTTTSAAATSTEPLDEDEEMLEVERDTAPHQQTQGPPTSISRYTHDTLQSEKEGVKKDRRKEKIRRNELFYWARINRTHFLFFVHHAY
jgi:hypothetical protein